MVVAAAAVAAVTAAVAAVAAVAVAAVAVAAVAAIVDGEMALSCVVVAVVGVAVAGMAALGAVESVAKSILFSPVVGETAKPMKSSSSNVDTSVGVTVVVAAGCTCFFARLDISCCLDLF